jgi:solute carrier family 50 protein (sugar transporter)
MPGAVESVFRVVAGCTSLMMILSPSPAVYQIYKTRQTGHTSIISLVSVLANCHVWMMDGYLTDNMFPVFATFLAGDFIALVYLAVYLRATTERKYVLQVIGVYVAVLLAISVYALLGGLGVLGLSRSTVNTIMGYIATCVSLVLYSSPFIKMREVLRTKTAESMPIHMVIAGGINNTMWIVYTPLAGLWFLFVTNVVCCTFAVSQFLLYLIYHPSKARARRAKAAHGEDLLVKEEDASTLQVEASHLSISIDRQSRTSAVPESPIYQIMPSPLAPLR